MKKLNRIISLIFLFVLGWGLFLPFTLSGLIFSGIIILIGKIFRSKEFYQYGFNLAHAIDQFGNCLLLGDDRETISSRTGRAIKSRKPKIFVKCFAKFINSLAFIIAKQKNHVIKAIDKYPENDRELWSWIKKD